MDSVQRIVVTLDYMLNTGRKRRIVGGILLSVSLLFAGLALTSLTIKAKEDEENNEASII